MLQNRELIKCNDDLEKMLFHMEFPYLKDAEITQKKLIKTNVAYQRPIITGDRDNVLVASVGHHNSGYFDI